MQPPQADLTVVFEGLEPDQVKLLQAQLNKGSLGAMIDLVDRNDRTIADVALREY